MEDVTSEGIFRFNPRARGGRDMKAFLASIIVSSFNPRARGGRDLLSASMEITYTVSIHAPAGGATQLPQGRGSSIVSIHAPAGGATSKVLHGALWHRVSIHAPAGGAT